MHQTGREIVRGRAKASDGNGNLRIAGGEGIANVDAGKSKAPRLGAGLCDSEGDGARTRNHRIDNPVL